MAENNNARCEIEKERIDRLEDRMDIMTDKVSDIDKNSSSCLASITKSLENLSTLPKLVNDMGQTMIKMQYSINGLENKVSDIENKLDSNDKKVETINEEGKINLRLIIKKYWWVGIIVGGAVVVLVRNFINNGTIKF